MVKYFCVTDSQLFCKPFADFQVAIVPLNGGYFLQACICITCSLTLNSRILKLSVYSTYLLNGNAHDSAIYVTIVMYHCVINDKA